MSGRFRHNNANLFCAQTRTNAAELLTSGEASAAGVTSHSFKPQLSCSRMCVSVVSSSCSATSSEKSDDLAG